jgi:hypothetical protein
MDQPHFLGGRDPDGGGAARPGDWPLGPWGSCDSGSGRGGERLGAPCAGKLPSSRSARANTNGKPRTPRRSGNGLQPPLPPDSHR